MKKKVILVLKNKKEVELEIPEEVKITQIDKVYLYQENLLDVVDRLQYPNSWFVYAILGISICYVMYLILLIYKEGGFDYSSEFGFNRNQNQSDSDSDSEPERDYDILE